MNPELEIILGMTACMAYEPSYKEYEDFPYTDEPVCILGKTYSILYDLEELRLNICSKLWFTYRKNFCPIGGTGPVSDKGWGCMLRCGQMIMAQALIFCHLGRDWTWNPRVPEEEYITILKMFQDKKDCLYSIHQIAQMGVSEGKEVGQWFGPNTVAQVLRKLAVYDEWSHVVVHVALDNAVVIDDLKMLCKGHQIEGQSNQSINETSSSSLRNGINGHESLVNKSPVPTWKPLMLFIPLRLGLSEINPVYLKCLKMTFFLKQSLGIIGGKPNHALYFIGVVGNEVIYLDPHITQPVMEVTTEIPNDSTYHCPYGKSKRMHISQVNPSLALCFYFHSEEELDVWCHQVHKSLIDPEPQPLFELTKERPHHWPPLQLYDDRNVDSSLEFTFVEDRDSDVSDEDFEIIS